MPEDVSDAELITVAIDHRMLNWHTAMPGRVEHYYPERNTVDVFPMFYARVPCDDGDVMLEQYPVLPDVKLIFQRAGGFGITFPVQQGDFVLLVFCEAAFGTWRQTGNVSDPGDPERLGLSGAVAIPGIYPDRQNIANIDTSNMVLGKIGTPSAQIEITPDEIHLGAGASKGVARTDDKTGADVTMATWISTITTAFNKPGVMVGASGTLTPPTDFGKITGGSTKVKAED